MSLSDQKACGLWCTSISEDAAHIRKSKYPFQVVKITHCQRAAGHMHSHKLTKPCLHQPQITPALFRRRSDLQTDQNLINLNRKYYARFDDFSRSGSFFPSLVKGEQRGEALPLEVPQILFMNWHLIEWVFPTSTARTKLHQDGHESCLKGHKSGTAMIPPPLQIHLSINQAARRTCFTGCSS